MRYMPDRLYMLLKEHFGWRGKMGKKIREFEKPKFRDTDKVGKPKTTSGKRIRPKKAATNQ